MAANEESKGVEGAKEETQVAPQAAPVSNALLTREEFAAKLEALSARAKAAGMSPLQEMARSYAERGLKVLDSLLSGLEESQKKPAPEAPAAPTKKTA